MKNLIIIGHPDKNSFCYNGIFKTVLSELQNKSEEIEIIDLYRCSFARPRDQLVESFKKLIIWSENIYIISPVWWFRLTPRTETFFDEVFTPGFAYKFINITKTYAYPKPFLKDKKVRTYITHGSPSLPVLTLYVNSVKLRLVMEYIHLYLDGGCPYLQKLSNFGLFLLSLKQREKSIRVC